MKHPVNMNKLLKSVRSSSSSKDDLLKKSIMAQLSHSVKEIHYCAMEENKNSGVNDMLDAANSLCTAVEAMFLQGLRDSLTHRFRKALSDLDNQPEPSFWSPLLVISHRQIIDQVMKLSQISNEVGQCRAWVRIVLNDCLLSSYMMTMRQDTTVLKSFYKPAAFVRDGELLDLTQRLIEGIETFKNFTLPYNSSLLNTWPLPSLVLAGIWVPAMKICPVTPCDDVAQSLDDSSKAHLGVESASDTASLSSAMSINSQTSSLRQMVALSEDEILKIILSKRTNAATSASSLQGAEGHISPKPPKSPPPSVPETSVKTTEGNGKSVEEAAKSTEESANCSVGNQLNRRSGWSFEDEHPASEEKKEVSVKQEPAPEIGKEKIPLAARPSDTSFKALVDSYSMLSGGYIKTPDWREVMQKFNSEMINQGGGAPNQNNNDVSKVSNEVVEITVKVPEVTPISSYVCKIAQEKGMDSQNFECADCKEPLNISHKPQVCNFTGEYFCGGCMSTEQMPIPARIIHNWDHKKYPVSKKASKYISEVKDDPLIDFKILNPYIYGVVEEMAVLQSLRNQLNFVRAYLYTCRKPVIEELQKQMWPREYMYEHIHQYSISDLNEVRSNELAQQLEKVIAFGKEHVLGCWLCSQKGFVCEKCNKPKALFPFDVDQVYRCDLCSAVFHKGCLSSSMPCPKCTRKKKREESSGS